MENTTIDEENLSFLPPTNCEGIDSNQSSVAESGSVQEEARSENSSSNSETSSCDQSNLIVFKSSINTLKR